MENTEKDEIGASYTHVKIIHSLCMLSIADDILHELNMDNKLAKNLLRNAKINLGRANDELMKKFDETSGDILNSYLFMFRQSSEGFLCLNERDRRSVFTTIENKLKKQIKSQQNGKSE